MTLARGDVSNLQLTNESQAQICNLWFTVSEARHWSLYNPKPSFKSPRWHFKQERAAVTRKEMKFTHPTCWKTQCTWHQLMTSIRNWAMTETSGKLTKKNVIESFMPLQSSCWKNTLLRVIPTMAFWNTRQEDTSSDSAAIRSLYSSLSNILMVYLQ